MIVWKTKGQHLRRRRLLRSGGGVAVYRHGPGTSGLESVDPEAVFAVIVTRQLYGD